MSRRELVEKMRADSAANEQAAVEAEVETLNAAPPDIPADVWALIQETGKLATERLHELLASPRFVHYKPADKARLIALAQNRAYGMPRTGAAAGNNKRRGGTGDVTAAELRELTARAALPEYKLVHTSPVIDVEFEE